VNDNKNGLFLLTKSTNGCGIYYFATIGLTQTAFSRPMTSDYAGNTE